MSGQTRDLKLQLIMATLDKSTGPLRKINRSSDQLTKSLKESRDKLRALQAQQRQLDSFSKLQKATGDTAHKLDQAKQRTAAFAQQIKATDNPSKTLITRFEQSIRKAQRLKQAHAENQTKLHQLNNELKKSGISTSNLERQQTRLQRKMQSATGAIDQQKKKLAELAEQQKKVRERTAALNKIRTGGMMAGAHGVGAAYAGQRMMGGMFGLLTPGLDFDAQMSQVQALARLKKNDPLMEAIRAQAKQLGANTTFTASEVGQGQGFLAMAGFTPKAITDAMPGMLSLAKAAGEELGATADISSNILTGFKLNAADMGRVGDVLTGTFTRSNTTLSMLGETMGYVAPVAAGLGSDIEVVAAMAGKLGDAGIQGSRAGTALRAIYSRLAAPPKAAADALDQLNVSTVDAMGNLRPMATILAEMAEQAKRLGAAERASLFKDIAGDEAFSALEVLVNQAGKGDLQRMIKTLMGTNGEALAVAKEMSDNARGDLAAMSSAWQDVTIGLTEANNSPLRGLIQDITSVIRAVGEWIRTNPALASGLFKILAIAAALITVLGFIGISAGAAMIGFSALAKALPLVTTAFRVLTAAMLTNPIGLVLTGIALAASLIYANWDGISSFFSDIWQSISNAFSGGIGGITKLLLNWSPLGMLYRAIRPALDWLGLELPERLTDLFSDGDGSISDSTRNRTRQRGAIRVQATQPLQNPALAGAGRGVRIDQLNVHPAPGMDEQALAQKVTQELDRRERAQQTRRGSRMNDGD